MLLEADASQPHDPNQKRELDPNRKLFTGIDSHGHKWENGVQVALDKEQGPGRPTAAPKDQTDKTAARKPGPVAAKLNGQDVSVIAHDPDNGLAKVKTPTGEQVVKVDDLEDIGAEPEPKPQEHSVKDLYTMPTKDFLAAGYDGIDATCEALASATPAEVGKHLVDAFGPERAGRIAKKGKSKNGMIAEVKDILEDRLSKMERGEVIAGMARKSEAGATPAWVEKLIADAGKDDAAADEQPAEQPKEESVPVAKPKEPWEMSREELTQAAKGGKIAPTDTGLSDEATAQDFEAHHKKLLGEVASGTKPIVGISSAEPDKWATHAKSLGLKVHVQPEQQVKDENGEYTVLGQVHAYKDEKALKQLQDAWKITGPKQAAAMGRAYGYSEPDIAAFYAENNFARHDQARKDTGVKAAAPETQDEGQHSVKDLNAMDGSRFLKQGHAGIEKSVASLATMPLADLQKHMVDAFGAESANRMIKTGKSRTGVIKEVHDRLTERMAKLERGEVIAAGARLAQKASLHESLEDSALLEAEEQFDTPYVAWDAKNDHKTRQDHSAMMEAGLDGTNIYRADDPAIRRVWAPCGYECRCKMRPVTVEEAAAAGVAEAIAWLETGETPVEPARVGSVPIQAPKGWVSNAPALLRESHDVSQEARDSGGKWTATASPHERATSAIGDVLARLEKDTKTPQTKTLAFMRWFGDSKVVDEQGEPLRVFHGSPELFDSFDAEIGKEFGGFGASGVFFSASPDVASSYAGHQSLKHKEIIRKIEAAEAEFEAFERTITDKAQTPAPSERMRWRWMNDLLHEGTITREEYDKYGQLEDAADDLRNGDLTDEEAATTPNVTPVYLSLQNPKIVDANKLSWDMIVPHHMTNTDRSIYDGIIFRNVKDSGDEAETVTDTYVAFHPNQIKSATGNRGTFDPKSAKLHESLRESLALLESAHDLFEDQTTHKPAGTHEGGQFTSGSGNPSTAKKPTPAQAAHQQNQRQQKKQPEIGPKEAEAQADGIVAKYKAKLTETIDKVPGGKWLREKAQAANDKLKERYGEQATKKILASACTISWGAFIAGPFVGFPNYIPVSVAMLPAVAIAEIYYQLGGKKKPDEGRAVQESHAPDALSDEEAHQLGKQLVVELTATWKGCPQLADAMKALRESAEARHENAGLYRAVRALAKKAFA